MDLRRGTQLAVDHVVTVLNQISRAVTSKAEVSQVGSGWVYGGARTAVGLTAATSISSTLAGRDHLGERGEGHR